MSPRTLRITVSGSFQDLTEDQRNQLRARAADHDLLRASFTAEGDLTYDIDSRPFFTYRFLYEAETDEDLAPAVASAEDTARAALEQRGLSYRLRSTRVQDLSQAPLSKRQRRELVAPVRNQPATTKELP